MSKEEALLEILQLIGLNQSHERNILPDNIVVKGIEVAETIDLQSEYPDTLDARRRQKVQELIGQHEGKNFDYEIRAHRHLRNHFYTEQLPGEVLIESKYNKITVDPQRAECVDLIKSVIGNAYPQWEVVLGTEERNPSELLHVKA